LIYYYTLSFHRAWYRSTGRNTSFYYRDMSLRSSPSITRQGQHTDWMLKNDSLLPEEIRNAE
jgi:hypothetical protein